MCLEGSVNIKLQKAAHCPIHAQVMPGVKAQLEPLVFCVASHKASLFFCCFFFLLEGSKASATVFRLM